MADGAEVRSFGFSAADLWICGELPRYYLEDIEGANYEREESSSHGVRVRGCVARFGIGHGVDITRCDVEALPRYQCGQSDARKRAKAVKTLAKAFLQAVDEAGHTETWKDAIAAQIAQQTGGPMAAPPAGSRLARRSRPRGLLHHAGRARPGRPISAFELVYLRHRKEQQRSGLL